MLESLWHAWVRGAKCFAEFAGVWSSDVAYHMTAPREYAEGMIAAMRRAI